MKKTMAYAGLLVLVPLMYIATLNVFRGSRLGLKLHYAALRRVSKMLDAYIRY